MTIPELLEAIANRLKRVEIAGLDADAIHYPALNSVPKSPCVMIRQQRDNSTAIERTRAAGQMIDVGVELIVLVKAATNQPRSEARIDPLLAPIVDAFDPDSSGDDIADMLQVRSDEIDHVFTRVTINRMPVDWAGTDCYAAYISFDAVIRRRAVALSERT